MEETMPVGFEKHDFRNSIEQILEKLLAFIVRQDSNQGTELIDFLPNITPDEPSIRFLVRLRPSGVLSKTCNAGESAKERT